MKSQKQLGAAALLLTKQRGWLSQKGLPECLLEVQAGKAKMQLKCELSVNQYGSIGQKARREANVSFSKIYPDYYLRTQVVRNFKILVSHL